MLQGTNYQLSINNKAAISWSEVLNAHSLLCLMLPAKFDQLHEQKMNDKWNPLPNTAWARASYCFSFRKPYLEVKEEHIHEDQSVLLMG